MCPTTGLDHLDPWQLHRIETGQVWGRTLAIVAGNALVENPAVMSGGPDSRLRSSSLNASGISANTRATSPHARDAAGVFGVAGRQLLQPGLSTAYVLLLVALMLWRAFRAVLRMLPGPRLGAAA